MTRLTIQNWIRQEPFQPFEIWMSNGEKYTVPHPEYAALGLTNLIVMNPESDNYCELALLHGASVERIETSAGAANET